MTNVNGLQLAHGVYLDFTGPNLQLLGNLHHREFQKRIAWLRNKWLSPTALKRRVGATQATRQECEGHFVPDGAHSYGATRVSGN